MGNYSAKEGAEEGHSNPISVGRSYRDRTTDESQEKTASKFDSIHSYDTSKLNDSVPTVFKWDHGGKNVYITGTFNGKSIYSPCDFDWHLMNRLETAIGKLF